jgi:PiT family inorganic phosphate transporter
MYLTSEALRLLVKDKTAELSTEDVAKLNAYKKSLDNSTKFIPPWVKVAVAIALGVGTMIGWKRKESRAGLDIDTTGRNHAVRGLVRALPLAVLEPRKGALLAWQTKTP